MKQVLLAVSLHLFLTSCGKPQQSIDPQPIFEESVRNLPNGTQLSIAIIENENMNFYGLEFINGTAQPIENFQKAFEIGSISKVFTSMLLAEYVLKGKLLLDDPVTEHLPFSLKDGSRISFKQLANHTSGLPRLPSNFEPNDPVNPYEHYNEEKLKSYLTESMELVDRGFATKKWTYS